MTYLEPDSELDGRPIPLPPAPGGMDSHTLRRLGPIELLLVPHRGGFPLLPSPKAEEPEPRARHRPTLLELLVILALIGVLIGILLPSGPSDHWTWVTERRLASWKPDPSKERAPNASLLASEAPLSGLWLSRDGGYCRSSILLSPISPGSYEAEFASGCCTGDIALKRTAARSDGILTLDRPVEEAMGRARVFRTLYAIRVRGRVFLVQANRMKAVEALIADAGPGVLANREFQRAVYALNSPESDRPAAGGGPAPAGEPPAVEHAKSS